MVGERVAMGQILGPEKANPTIKLVIKSWLSLSCHALHVRSGHIVSCQLPKLILDAVEGSYCKRKAAGSKGVLQRTGALPPLYAAISPYNFNSHVHTVAHTQLCSLKKTTQKARKSASPIYRLQNICLQTHHFGNKHSRGSVDLSSQGKLLCLTTVLPVNTVITLFLVITLFPVLAVLPIITVITVNTVLTVFTVSTVLAVIAALTVITVLTVLAVLPIITSITVITVLTVLAVLPIITFIAVITVISVLPVITAIAVIIVLSCAPVPPPLHAASLACCLPCMLPPLHAACPCMLPALACCLPCMLPPSGLLLPLRLGNQGTGFLFGLKLLLPLPCDGAPACCLDLEFLLCYKER
eukprot:1150370-Pelagomonas_calceolata.AAC.6